MPDIFDTIAPQPKGDVFDEVAPSTPAGEGDIFDTLEQGPSVGQMATGAGVEVGFGLAGEAAGAALAPFTMGASYPIAKFVSGVGGSIAAQQIEERPQISYGRALAAGLMNLIPGAALGKGAKVGQIIGTEAVRGAAIGAGEATVTSMIDEQRLPTGSELMAYAGGGALGGAVLGGAFKGGKELVAAAKPSELLNSFGEVGQKIAAAAAPSKVLGPDIQDAVIEGKNAVLSMAELGGRVARQTEKVITKQSNPDAARAALNDYIDGKATTLPSYLQSLSGDIDIAREKIKELQTALLANIDAGYVNASPELRQKIEESISSGNYLTREYEFFTNAKYKPTDAQYQAARGELIVDYLDDASKAGTKLSYDQAAQRADNYLTGLNSKKLSIIKNDDYYPSAIDGFLKERKDIGPALASYLGEITDPGERLRGTLTRVARGVYRDQTDGKIVEFLSRYPGLVSSTPTDSLTAELKLRRFQPINKLYVSPVIQEALNEMYVSQASDKSSNMLVRGFSDFWNTSVGASKAVKVLLNPPSYMVQLYSNAANLAGMGINPFGNSGRALRVALAEFGPLEQITQNPTARKALLTDIADATKYGIKGANILESDIRDNIERGFFSENLQKGLGFFSKSYTVADNAGRYVAWKANQKMLQRIYPGADPEAIKKLAANITNDTYQNYDRLSNTVKRLSRAGIMPQFAAFTAEFARNQYNQGRYIKQMLTGNFGQNVTGLGPANVNAMRAEGAKRLASLAAVYGSTYAVIDGINQNNNVSREKEAALKESVLGEWESDNKLAILLNEDGTGKYMNPSYLVPHTVAVSAFDAGMNDQPIDALSNIIANEIVGEGSFLERAVYASLFNIDPRTKKPISYQTDQAKNVADRISFVLKDAFLPGVARETEKLGKAMRGEGNLKVEDVMRRQVGLRYNDFNVLDGAKMRLRGSIDNIKAATSDYNAARDYRQLAPAQLEVVYQTANGARMDALAQITRHVQNLRTLGLDTDTIAGALKDTGLSTKDILGVFTNTVEELPRDRVTTPSEIYAGITTLPKEQQGKAIVETARGNPDLLRKLNDLRREDVRTQARKIGTMDKLILGLNVDNGERARFISRSAANMGESDRKAYLTDLRRKQIINGKVESQLRALP